MTRLCLIVLASFGLLLWRMPLLRSRNEPGFTATAMGTMIRVVEVLETIIDRIAVAAMKANSSAPGVVPPRLTMASARRRWRPVRSIAKAMIAPPRTRNRIGE